MAQMVKNLLAMQETEVQSSGGQRPCFLMAEVSAHLLSGITPRPGPTFCHWLFCLAYKL